MHSLKKTWFRSVLSHQIKSPSFSALCTSAPQNNANVDKETIVIPNRIERGPTDILKALSQTIRRDPLAPHYKYHDDPFTIPVSNAEKRVFALAQESGRKAAQWIRSEHAELFQHKVAEPPIEIFAPKLVFKEDEPVSPELLSKIIANSSVTDAIKTYQKLEKENIEVSDELKQSLLELVCFYNCEDTVPEDLLEERWFTHTKFIAPKHNTWKDGDFAETLFRSFPEPGVEQYASIIQGMLKFNQVERGLSLFEEAKSKGLLLPVDVYNLILGRVNFVKEGFEQRWQMIVEVLGEMNQAQLRPTVKTLNEVLLQLSYMASFREGKKLALKTLSEMRKFGVKPSLASYNHLLYLFCRDRGPKSGLLYSILDDIEGRLASGETFQPEDTRDNQFFFAAMDIARRHLADANCAYRVDKLLHRADHYNFIGDSSRESGYYRNFFFLVLAQEPFETYMELYDRLVPNVYSPEKSVMLETIKAADLAGKVEYFPRLWAEIDMLDHWQQEDTINLFLETINRNLSISSPELIPQLADVVWSVYTKIEEYKADFKDRRTQGQEWTAPTLGHILSVLLADNRLDNAGIIFSRLLKEDLAGVPEFSTVEKYFNVMVEAKNLPRAMTILQYLNDLGFSNLQPLGDKLESNFSLSTGEQIQVKTWVGTSKPKEQTEEEDELI
ncbi:hypothetical protein M8J77_014206 [Diaphorina citri]|nr:hypothetical protein M8J77_014206 [Diaphorina citri]